MHYMIRLNELFVFDWTRSRHLSLISSCLHSYHNIRALSYVRPHHSHWNLVQWIIINAIFKSNCWKYWNLAAAVHLVQKNRILFVSICVIFSHWTQKRIYRWSFGLWNCGNVFDHRIIMATPQIRIILLYITTKLRSQTTRTHPGVAWNIPIVQQHIQNYAHEIYRLVNNIFVRHQQ